MKQSYRLQNPVQAHKCLTLTVWPAVKGWLVSTQTPLMLNIKPVTRSAEQNFIQFLRHVGALGRAAAQKVQPPAAHDQPHPGHRRAQRCTVVRSRAPDVEESLLQHVLGPLAVADHPHGQPEKFGRAAVIECFQRGMVVAGHAVQQRDQLGVSGFGVHGQIVSDWPGHCRRSPRVRRAALEPARQAFQYAPIAM